MSYVCTTNIVTVSSQVSTAPQVSKCKDVPSDATTHTLRKRSQPPPRCCTISGVSGVARSSSTTAHIHSYVLKYLLVRIASDSIQKPGDNPAKTILQLAPLQPSSPVSYSIPICCTAPGSPGPHSCARPPRCITPSEE